MLHLQDYFPKYNEDEIRTCTECGKKSDTIGGNWVCDSCYWHPPRIRNCRVCEKDKIIERGIRICEDCYRDDSYLDHPINGNPLNTARIKIYSEHGLTHPTIWENRQRLERLEKEKKND